MNFAFQQASSALYNLVCGQYLSISDKPVHRGMFLCGWDKLSYTKLLVRRTVHPGPSTPDPGLGVEQETWNNPRAADIRQV